MSTHTMNQFLYSKMTYDPVRDVTPITMIANVASVLAAHPSLPAKNIRELIVLARTRPGQLNFASGSSVYQLCGELLRMTAKIDIVHVPYKGGSQAVTDLLGGQIEMLFTGAPLTLPHIKAGKLKVLAVTNTRRAQVLPDVPTIGETLPGYEFNNWYGLMAPAGTSAADRRPAEFRDRSHTWPARRAREASGAGRRPGADDTREIRRGDENRRRKSGRLIKAAGVKAD